MIQIEISDLDRNKAKTDRFEHPDVYVQKRLHILYLKALEYSHKAICEIVGISYTTMEHVLKTYQEGGLEAVCNVTYNVPNSELDEHRQTIEEYFRENPPATVSEACGVIKELTGLTRGKTQVRKFLVNLGMRPRKSGVIPGKCDPEAQEEFKKKVSTRSCRRLQPESATSIL